MDVVDPVNDEARIVQLMFGCEAIARRICHVYDQTFPGGATEIALMLERLMYYSLLYGSNSHFWRDHGNGTDARKINALLIVI